MLLASRQCLCLTAAGCILLIIATLYRYSPIASYTKLEHSASPSSDASPVSDAANSTLGFQAIFALSAGPSWRTRGLLAAANLTGLEITLPPQPPISAAVVTAFQALGDGTHPTQGASKAWLAHLDLIKHIHQSRLDTALILEDDVDWDRALRSQAPRIAAAVRNLTHTPPTEDNNNDAPYGRAWDLLWLGHCGEFWEDSIETVVFDDPATIPHAQYSGWAREYIARLPDRRRAVYRSYNPVCSFAYALSRDGAQKVLELVGGGGDEAFDIAVMHHCRAGRLECLSVVPEVVHQYFPAERFGVKSLVDVGNGEVDGPGKGEEEGEDFEAVMGSTENILESARCWALWRQTCLRL
ncbi:glycosyltransferase family 25 protein [Aspergillus aculeatus ATCC 16872]|uniref:Glycosyltransferase family 25 protein n=1 Tax=Aspergillus aculeatus (strain ATCC 16872 / CBS 172.66 / WB 5094) TaxID=690307 RepID=A0A1L9WHF1_ASPA1|nr:glycosyltransferase family 25 protein [Aspergillus aculeatus ATCC 16872]OJJ95598.1 glycosyltransferase family 25 protein [Aspergillus aculeatus ATCC 16872]